MIDPTLLTWPDPPNNVTDKDLKKALYEAKLGVITNQLATLADREKTARASYDTQNQAVLNVYLDVAKGQLDRAVARAEFIEKAAGTIATVYTGILAFTYSADLTKGKAFPAVGIAPTIFLGLSIFFSMFYLSYITQPRQFKAAEPSALLPQHLINERNNFIGWATNAVLERAPWLQTAVISLGFGILFLPVVYLATSVSETVLWCIVVSCVVLTIVHLIVSSIIQSHTRQDS